MPEQFPYIGYHFDVLFLTPGLNINANFKTVSGLGFDSGTATEAEGGLSGFSHQLTDRGSYKNLTLTRGFTDDKRLFDWCESTHNTLKVKPCNILVSLLNKQQLPVKSWLLFHAIPKNWTGGDLGVDNSTVMMESITFSYQKFHASIMAIKINELQVNVHFENQDGANVPSQSTEQLSDYTPSMNNDKVVQKAVKEVMRILNERNER